MKFAFWRRAKRNSELDEELRSHLTLAEREEMQSGRTSKDAGSAARREFGNVALAEEVTRDSWGFVWFHDLLHDLRYGFRILRKNPGFTAIAVATLALGIGLNATFFSVFSAVALKPIPVRDAGTVMRLERWFASGRLGSSQYMFSWQEYKYLKQRNHSFPELIAVSNLASVNSELPAVGGPSATRERLRLTGQLVTANYFAELAGNAFLGRTFAADENQVPGAHPVVVLSFPSWQRKLNSDPAVVGKILTLNGTPFTIIGVAPQEFIGTANPPRTPDFWAPAMMQAQIVPGQDWLNDPLDPEFQLLGHEVQVAAPPRGASELSVLIRQFQSDHPDPEIPPNADPITTGTAITTRVSLQLATPFGNTEDLRFHLVVVLLMTIVGMVLLIACANLANMLLARASGRHLEIGVRTALGASRVRLVRQLLTESMLLALLGGASGLLISRWAANLLWSAITPFISNSALTLPRSADPRVFAYTLLISLVTGAVFGLTPALRVTKSAVAAALKDSESIGSNWKRSQLRQLLIGGQVAISMMFLISAGLLARGLMRSQSADPGYPTRPIYLLPLDFGNDVQQANIRARRVINTLQPLPAVQDVTVVERPPMLWTWTVTMRAKDSTSAQPPWASLANHVSGSYFQTMSIPIVRGRTFTRAEEQFGSRVAVISEATARSLWPGQDPLGHSIDFILRRNGPWTTYQVVGVVGDVRTANLTRTDPAIVYFAATDSELSSYWLAVRTRGDAHSAISAIGEALAPVDVRFASGFRALNLEDDVVRTQKAISQTLSMSAASLAGLALLLATTGIYGVASFIVSQREREVGIRMALGASAGDVLRLMIAYGMKPVIFGTLVGVAGSFAVSAVLRATLVFPASEDFLYGVNSFDPATFLALSGFVVLIALAACYIPARRAMTVDPIVALRYE